LMGTLWELYTEPSMGTSLGIEHLEPVPKKVPSLARSALLQSSPVRKNFSFHPSSCVTNWRAVMMFPFEILRSLQCRLCLFSTEFIQQCATAQSNILSSARAAAVVFKLAMCHQSRAVWRHLHSFAVVLILVAEL
jgi:hypothetical protein